LLFYGVPGGFDVRVLVTGAAGFVGRNLTRYLAARGNEVIKTDLREGDVTGDLLDEDFVLGRLAEHDFDALVHLAAITRIPTSIEDPHRVLKVNMLSTLNVLELAARKGARVVLSSSANVYGVPSQLPVSEQHPVRPRTPYDYSKYVSELLVQAFGAARGLRFSILRSWKLFGEFDAPTSAVMRFIGAALRSKPIPLYNAGRDATDFVHVENFCRMVELVLANREAEGMVFNVGTGRLITVRELAQTIVRLTGSSSQLVDWPPRTPQEAEPLVSYPSIERAVKVLGYEVVLGFEEGLARTLEWVKRHGLEGLDEPG
jgi:nucleoside-diphosphate-sugar epimerase